MNTQTHVFQESLRRSHSASDMPFWETCYSQFFPTMLSMVDHRQDGDHQRMGIDRSVILENGKCYWIDEKVRFKAYNDIALEEWSDQALRKPGWVCKPLMCDYIAYAIAPSGKCYLLPVPQLQQAWRDNCTLWKGLYREVQANNLGYVTISWAIPAKVLFLAIARVLRATFTPMQCDN